MLVVNFNAVSLMMYFAEQTCQPTSNDGGNSNSVIFLILLVIAAVINILLTSIIIYLVIRVRKSGFSPNNA